MSAFQTETKALSADASVVLDWVTGNTSGDEFLESSL